MIALKLVWRQMWLRPGRTLLTLAGVTIGVAAVVAMVLLQANARRQFDQVRESLSGKGALEVVARSGGRFDASAAEIVAHTPDVAEAAPTLRQITTLYAGERRVKALFIGVEPGRETRTRDLELVAGRLATGPAELVLDADFARSLGVQVGQTVKVLTRQLLVRWTVVGLVRSEGAPGSNGATALMPLETLREAFSLAGKADLVQVLLKPQADPKAVEAALAARLPEFLTVRAAGAYRTAGEQNFELMDLALRATSVLLVVIAGFISLNTFLMNVGERLPLFAVLRGVGATSRQIAGMLMVEAASLGIVGSAIGVALGVLASRPLINEFGKTLEVGADELATPSGLILGGLILGPLTVVAAAAYPTYRASRIGPLANVRGTSITERRLPTYLAPLGALSLAL
ncbi:MAG TPA: ABC transporter permease, partial [Pirellulales bacterium]